MKSLIFTLALLACYAHAAEHYTNKYDSVNVDMILKNKRLLDNYVRCLLDKGKCNEEGRTLKEVLPDALLTNCAKCSEAQRARIEKTIRFLVKERREQFDELAAKYDPQGTYRSNYQRYLN